MFIGEELGEIFKRFILCEVQEQKSQQKKGKKNPSREEEGLLCNLATAGGRRAGSCNAVE